MNAKKKIRQMIEKNAWIMKLYIFLYNKTHIEPGSMHISSFLCRNNNIVIKGKNNRWTGEKTCSIQNNVISIVGEENEINFENGVSLENKCSIRVNGNNNRIIIEKNCKLSESSLFIWGNNNLVYIGESCSGIFVEFHIEQDNNSIIIKKNTTMHGRQYRPIHFALDEGTTIKVGEDCMFSNNIQFRSTDSHSIVDLNGKRINYAQNIEIGNHCWLGLGCMVMKGVKMTDNIVIAAGSICTKEYMDKNVILAGNPAKVVKRNVNWDRKFL